MASVRPARNRCARMGAYNVLATCDDRRSVLSQDGRPKTGAAMAMQILVAIVLVQGRCVIIGVVLCSGRCYVLIEPCDFRNVAACIDSNFLPRPSATSEAQCQPPAHHAPRDVQAQTALDCRSSMIDWSRTIVRRFSRGSQMMIDDRRCTLPLGIMIDCLGTLMQRILRRRQTMLDVRHTMGASPTD